MRWATVIGVLLVAAGVFNTASLYQRAERIRDHATTVPARVETKGPRVSYQFHGKTYRTQLTEIVPWLPPNRGSVVTLSIDPDDPGQAALPKFVTAPWLQRFSVLPWILACVCFVGGRAARDRTEPTESALKHPEPAWAHAANGTLRTLTFTSTTRLSREEILAVRYVRPDVAEVCCVPFLQLRLSLGDLVRVRDDGLAGEATAPSGRVTFAVRCDEGGAEQMRALGRLFPDAVVEGIDGERLYAVAAVSDDEARLVRAWLDEREGGGLLAYRSVLRLDARDEPLA